MKDQFFNAINANDADLIRSMAEKDSSLLHAAGPGGWPAIHLAAYMGKVDCLKALVECGADLELRSENENRNTPIHAAVAGGQIESVKFLANKGANLRATYAGGTQVLHEAAFIGRLDIARTLLELGAAKAARNDAGKTPEDVAKTRGHEEITVLLKE